MSNPTAISLNQTVGLSLLTSTLYSQGHSLRTNFFTVTENHSIEVLEKNVFKFQLFLLTHLYGVMVSHFQVSRFSIMQNCASLGYGILTGLWEIDSVRTASIR